MKRFLILIIMLGLALPALAQLTTKEEDDLKVLLSYKDRLVDLANILNLEKIPLQIQEKRKAQDALVAQRDLEIKVIKEQAEADIKVIFDSYQVQYDTLDLEIKELQNLIP